MPLRKTFSTVAFVYLAALFAPAAAHAALPAAVEGEPLPSLAPIVKRVSPAVVNIATRGHVEAQRHPFFDDPFFRHFFGVPEQAPQREVQSLGSGVIVNADKGYILTNHHVVRHADEIRVVLNDNREFDAKVIGSDEKTDVAVIQIEADGLAELTLADSDRLQVGDFVIAIGNPFGLTHTVTSGIVSALGRFGLNQDNLENFIQTDASINPGNSGGALVNLRGELVGINTAILSRSGGNIGIGFAIPINMARIVMDQILEYGEVKRGVLGVTVQNLTPELAKALDISQNEGAVVGSVTPDSGADKAGIKPGDVIIAVNDKPVNSTRDLVNTIGLLRVNEEVKLTLLRDGKRLDLSAEVGDPAEAGGGTGGVHPKLAGAQFAELSEASPLYGTVKGVLVARVDPRSPAATVGLRPGDVIMSVNRRPVTKLREFLNAVKGKDTLLLNVRRGNGAFFIVVN